MFNSNIGRDYTPLQGIRLRNLSDLEFDLPISLKGKGHDTTRLPIYGFLLICSSNIGLPGLLYEI